MTRRDLATRQAEEYLRTVLDDAATSDVRTMFAYGSSWSVPAERKFSSVEAVQRYVDGVLRLNWVRTGFPDRPGDRITVVANRGTKTAFGKHAEMNRSRGELSIPTHGGGLSWAMREFVVLHEVAHYLAPANAGHSEAWLSVFRELVAGLMNDDLAWLLGTEVDIRLRRDA